MLNQEITNVKALQELYEFGSKCYKKGYRRAGVDILAGFGLAFIALVTIGVIEKITTRED